MADYVSSPDARELAAMIDALLARAASVDDARLALRAAIIAAEELMPESRHAHGPPDDAVRLRRVAESEGIIEETHAWYARRNADTADAKAERREERRRASDA